MTRRPGLVSFVGLFVLLGLVLLAAVVWNAAAVSVRKLDTQTAADAAAQAAGLQLARSLNSVTAVNHLAGELLAVSALAHTPGGAELEAGTGFDLTPGVQADLEDAYRAAVECGRPVGRPPDAAAYAAVRAGRSDSGAAIGHARRRLKRVLTEALWLHAASCRGQPAGVAESQAVQGRVLVEWQTLAVLEAVAKADLLPLRRHVHSVVLPALNRHANRVAADTPDRMAAAARAAAGWNRATGSLGLGPAVPLVPDAPADWTRSQAVRAAAPWLVHWRKPVTTFAGRHLPLSGYADLTAAWSDRLLVELARQAAADAPTLVLTDRPADGDKGDETWTRRGGSALADERFAVLGLARRAAVPTFGQPLLVRPRPAGVVGFAQVLVWNRNPQTPAASPPGCQPVVGWDTLNWAGPVPELGASGPAGQPPIALGWGVRAVPATLARSAAHRLVSPDAPNLAVTH